MTSPDLYFPQSAANYGGLAAFAATTVAQYQEQTRGTWNPTLTVLQKGMDQVVGDVKTLVIDLAKLIDGVLGTGHTVEELAAFVLGLGTGAADLLDKLLHGGIPIISANLFGQIASELLPNVGIGSLGGSQPNLVTNPGFTGAISMDGQGIWSWDNTQDHTGTSGSGSAKVVADGGVKQLLSNSLAVDEGQQLALTVWTKWASLVYTGTPINLEVATYLNGASVTTVNIAHANVSSPSHDWAGVSGYYTVPAGVDAVRVRLAVTTASSGTVWFDDVSCKKVGLLGKALVDGLEDALASFVTLITHNALVDAIAGTIGADIAAVQARVNSFLTALSNLDAAKLIGTIADDVIFNPLNDLISAIGQALTGIVDAFTNNQILSFMTAQTQALIGLQAQVAQLQTVYTSGVSDGDDYERNPPSSLNLGAGWLQFYSTGGGTWAVPDGHNASWIKSGFGDRDVLNVRNAGQPRSATNNQRIVAVFNTPAEINHLLDIYGHYDLWLRISDSTSSLSNVSGIRVRFSGDGTISIDRFVAGSRTNLNSATDIDYAAGVSVSAEAGKPGIARYFKAEVNGLLKCEIAEVGTTSGLGDTYRRWGDGVRAEGNVLHIGGQTAPPSIRQIVMSDQ